MSQHQELKNAIEAFQPDGANAPILYSTTVYNDKGFRALLGRKLNGRQSVATGILIGLIVIVAITIIIILLARQTGTPIFVTYVPLSVFILLYRTTIITVSDTGLEFYFIDQKRGSKYAVYDKMSLPYDMITNTVAKTGGFNSRFTFEFSNDGKKYKISVSIPNKMKKMAEQADNLKYLHEALKTK